MKYNPSIANRKTAHLMFIGEVSGRPVLFFSSPLTSPSSRSHSLSFSLSLYIYLSFLIFAYLSIPLSTIRPVRGSIFPTVFIYLLSIYLSLSISLPVCLPICLFVQALFSHLTHQVSIISISFPILAIFSSSVMGGLMQPLLLPHTYTHTHRHIPPLRHAKV